MRVSGVNSRGRSRGVQQRPVHQGAVIAILNVIVRFAGGIAVLGLAGHSDLDWIFGVVEIYDVNVKDQHGRARNEVSCRERGDSQ